MRKKILSVVAVLAAVICLGATSVSAATESPQGGITIDLAGCVIPENTVLFCEGMLPDPANQEIQGYFDSLTLLKESQGISGSLVGAYAVFLTDAAQENLVEADANTMLRFNISGLTSYDTVTALVVSLDEQISVVKATSYDGYITLMPGAMGSISLYVQKGTAPSASSTGTATTAVSPKTGVYA